jgi:hypothetical protein
MIQWKRAIYRSKTGKSHWKSPQMIHSNKWKRAKDRLIQPVGDVVGG